MAELEKEMEALREEKKVVLIAMNDVKKFYLKGIADCKVPVNLLNQDFNVLREQIELVQMMLGEKEMLAHDQLEGAKKDEELPVRELKEN